MNSQSALRTPTIGRISTPKRVGENTAESIAELEIDTVEEIALLGVGRDEQRAQLHALAKNGPCCSRAKGT